MKKRMFIMLLSVGILFGGIFAYKLFEGMMIKRFLSANATPTMTVSTTHADVSPWQEQLTAVGSARAIQGVNVTTEIAGIVKNILFQPGSHVKAGDVLIELRSDADRALLQALSANAELGKITYDRDKKQFDVQAISKQTLDSDYQNMLNVQGLADQQAAIVGKKTITAPFTGRLGISAVNLGQYLNPGDKIVTLQTLDPIYLDFSLPQNNLGTIKAGMPVDVITEAFPNKKFQGIITTIDPLINTNTRNIQVEATIANPDEELTPGMFTLVNINIGEAKEYITLPQTAISFNPYGDVVFVVENKGKDEQGKDLLVAKQVFVKTGDTRGDEVEVLQGVTKGQIIVTSGQLKLKNGSHVAINNSVQLPNSANPSLPNDHD